MMKTKAFIPALLLASLLSPNAAARNQKEVFEGVRGYAASTAPGGVLEFDDTRDREASFGWTDGPEFLFIMISARPTVDAAREDFFHESEGMKARAGGAPDFVTGLCDESFVKEASDGKSSRLIFRKGVHFVQVFARTRRAAEEAAWNVVTLIPSE